MGRVGRARARRRVPGGAAEAGLDLLALALTDGGVDELSGQAQGRVEALALAVVVKLLEARALVGALALARGGVVDVGRVGAHVADADLGGGAENQRGAADAVAAVVVAVRALERNLGAHAVGGADGVAGLEGDAVTASSRAGAAARSRNTLLGGGAVGGVDRAVGDARLVVSGGPVVLLANQAEMVQAEGSRGLVGDAELDDGQASLEVMGGIVTRVAQSAGLVEADVGLAVRDDRNASPGVRGELVVGGAPTAVDGSGGVVLGDVGQAELDVGNATTSILSEVVAVEANSAQVFVSDVGQAVVNVLQAKIAVD